MRPELSVGILTADLARLADEIDRLDARARWAHIDVTDGTFTPESTVGAQYLNTVARCGIEVDAHLLIEHPRRILSSVIEAQPAMVTVPIESTDPTGALRDLAERAPNIVRGISIAPETDLDVLDPALGMADLILILGIDPRRRGPLLPDTGQRVATVRRMTRDRPLWIGVDGGVTLATAPQVASWKPDVIVSGSAIFDGNDPSANLDKICSALEIGIPA